MNHQHFKGRDLSVVVTDKDGVDMGKKETNAQILNWKTCVWFFRYKIHRDFLCQQYYLGRVLYFLKLVSKSKIPVDNSSLYELEKQASVHNC